MGTSTSNITFISTDTNFIAGLQKHKADLPATLPVAGQAMTPDELVAILEGRIEAAKAVAPAKAVYAKVVANNLAEREATSEIVKDLKAYVLLAHKKDPEILAAFGLTIKKPAVPTAATQVVAVARRKATRTLRGTRGPRQKKAIKATLTGPVVIDAGTGELAPPADKP